MIPLPPAGTGQPQFGAEAILDTVFAGAPVGFAFLDRELRYVRVNDTLAEVNGHPAAAHIGRTVLDVFPDFSPEVITVLRRVIESGEPVLALEMDGASLGRPAESRTWEVNLFPVRCPSRTVIGLGVVVTDVTERKRLEEQLRQAQKMEAVGRLAGGVAHDFNNLLTVITTCSELVLAGLNEADPRRDDVAEILAAARRGAALTRQLLTFSRRQMLRPRLIDANEVVNGLYSLLKRLIGEDIELVLVPGQGLARISIDPSQLEQALLNLAVNARDAMPQGGVLVIETSNARFDVPHPHAHGLIPAGEYVMIAVIDTGCGMTAEILARLFEPFFTTKEEGKGTGLGLSAVYGIVKASAGHATVESEAGRGSIFRLYVPRAAEAAPASQRNATPAEPRGGSERVLLVEDDPSVRTLVSRALEGAGYRVLIASNGLDALRMAQSESTPIDLLLTDVVMPHMSGRELAERMAALRPAARVLFMSGYTDDAVLRHGVGTRQEQLLQKPFTIDALLRRVRGTLTGVDA